MISELLIVKCILSQFSGFTYIYNARRAAAATEEEPWPCGLHFFFSSSADRYTDTAADDDKTADLIDCSCWQIIRL